MAGELLLSDKYKVFLKHDAPVEFLEGGQIKKDGDFIKKYDNAHEAARHLFPDDYKHKDRLISRCARGQAKTAYGYKWEYAE